MIKRPIQLPILATYLIILATSRYISKSLTKHKNCFHLINPEVSNYDKRGIFEIKNISNNPPLP